MNERRYLDVIPVDILTAVEILSQVTRWLEYSEKSRQIVTLNALMLMGALKNQSLTKVISTADLVIADGFGIMAALQRKGVKIPKRLTGIELVKEILNLPLSPSKSFFFYGGTISIVKQLKQAIELHWPEINKTAFWDGYSDNLTKIEVKQEIIRRQPDVLLVGLGTPAQELFLGEILPFLDKTIGIGVGGSFEVIAGVKKETPLFFRQQGLEWLWRIGQDPKRIKQIPDLFRFWACFLR